MSTKYHIGKGFETYIPESENKDRYGPEGRYGGPIYGPTEILRKTLPLKELTTVFPEEVLTKKHRIELLMNRSTTNKQLFCLVWQSNRNQRTPEA